MKRKNRFLTVLYLCIWIAFSASAQQYTMVDNFETHNWHWAGWGATGAVSYSAIGKTQGVDALQLQNTGTNGVYTSFITGCFNAETFTQITLDLKNGAVGSPTVRIEAYNSSGVKILIGQVALTPNQQILNQVFTKSPAIAIRSLIITLDNLGTNKVTVSVDNIRFGTAKTLWDPCEKHVYWLGVNDADNLDDKVLRSEDITHAIPHTGSTAVMAMQWNSTANTTSNNAEIMTAVPNLDYSNNWYFKFDVYRPSTTTYNVNIYAYVYDGSTGVASIVVNVPVNTWTTVYLPLKYAINLSHITQIKLGIEGTNLAGNTAGIIYFDNLQVGGFLPQATPLALSNPHLVKDFNNRLLSGNSFYGKFLAGNIAGATITPSIINTGSSTYYLKMGYNVSIANSYIFYSNILRLNSTKNKISLFLRADATGNPGRVKLEAKSSNGKKAVCYLSGITTVWKQWLVPFNQLQPEVSFDVTKITELVISLDNNTANSGAKTGAFYVDDITLDDAVGTSLTGLQQPEANSALKLKDIGVPYQVNDFDGYVPQANGTSFRDWNDFFGWDGIWKDVNTNDNGSIKISSVESGGLANSIPYSGKFSYTFDALLDVERPLVYYSEILYRVPEGEQSQAYVNATALGVDEIDFRLRSVTGKNPVSVLLVLKDANSKRAERVITGIANDQWKLYRVKLNTLSLETGFDFTKLKEVQFEIPFSFPTVKTGELYIDDISFVDNNLIFANTSAAFDFSNKNNAFLNLLEKSTFQYFLNSFHPVTGLVRDKSSQPDRSSVAATGFGLSALVIGVQRGWISRASAEAMVLKTLNTLYSVKQGNEADCSNSGYQGFFYHFLKSTDGTRKDATTELSNVDTGELLMGILTCRQYFSSNTDIVNLSNMIYDRVNWRWFLNQKPGDPHYNHFYIGWSPELGFEDKDHTIYYWDYYTDEAVWINLLAIGAYNPEFRAPEEVFYAWARNLGTYNNRTITMSYFGSLFAHTFAHCWFDLKDKTDALGLNFYNNAIQAGLANRDFCIAGKDSSGRIVTTYNANSWGLSACDAIPAGLSGKYLGENGALPQGRMLHNTTLSSHIDGTVPAYGGITMIGFCDASGAMPISYVGELARNFYHNTNLWTGFYGFRDCYTDADRVKPSATSKYPVYSNDHVSIDQGAMLLMIENYRSNDATMPGGLIRHYFMQSEEVQNAMNIIFGTGFKSAKVNRNTTDRNITLPDKDASLFKDIFVITPNPAHDMIRIGYGMTGQGSVKIDICDIFGRIVKTIAETNNAAGNYNLNVDISSLNNGIYFCRFTNGGDVKVVKLVIKK